MDFLFVLVPVFIVVVFVIVISTIVVRATKNLAEWQHNNSQPVLTMPAMVKTKRTQMGGGGRNRMVYTTHHVTFELESGVRMEFDVEGQEYGLLSEGDRGTLTYQGTRYHGFQRSVGEAARGGHPDERIR